MNNSENYLQMFVRILFANKRLIMRVMAVFFGLTVLISLFFPPFYELGGSVIVKAKKIEVPVSQMGDRGPASYPLPPETEDILTETRLLTSPELIAICVQQLMDEGVVFEEPPIPVLEQIMALVKFTVEAVKSVLPEGKSVVTLTEAEKLGIKFSIDMRAEIFPGSNIIDLKLWYGNPRVAVKLINRILDNYLEFRLEKLSSEATSDFLITQLERYDQQLAELGKEKLRLQNLVSVADVGSEITGLVSQMGRIQEDLIGLESEERTLSSRVVYLDTLYADYVQNKDNRMVAFPHDFGDEEIRRLSERFNSLAFEYSDESRTFKGGTPKLDSLRREIDTQRETLLYLVEERIRLERNTLESLTTQIRELRSTLAGMDERKIKLSEAQIDLDRIDHGIALLEQNHETFANKYEEAIISRNNQINQITNVQVIGRASIPPKPLFPRPEIVIPLGLVASFFLAFGFGFLREFFDHTFKTPAQVEETLGLPVIGSIPLGPASRDFRALEARSAGRSRRKDRWGRLAGFLVGLVFCILIAGAVSVLFGWMPVGLAVLAVVLVIYLIFSRRWMLVRDSRIPVVVYHGFSRDPASIFHDTKALAFQSFEKQLKYLASKGYQTPSLEELQKHVAGQGPLPRKSVVLTIDDGFLDCWVAAYPLLKKYGFKATLFAPTDFIEDGKRPRPTLEAAWKGEVKVADLPWRGHANWAELRLMEGDGVIAVEGHTKQHSWLFTSDRISDFYLPGDQRHWMYWNAFPEKKPLWFETIGEDESSLWGLPVFENDRSHLVERAFIPDPAFCRYLNDFVMRNGEREFFSQPDWREQLARWADGYEKGRGRFETDEEAAARLQGELTGSRQLLEQRLNKSVRYLCWPGDRYDQRLLDAAQAAGWSGTTRVEGLNRVGENARSFARMYPPCSDLRRGMGLANHLSFVSALKVWEGNFYFHLPFSLANAMIKLSNKVANSSRANSPRANSPRAESPRAKTSK